MGDGLMFAEGWGAGNFFRLAAVSGGGAGASVIELDKPYTHPRGRTLWSLDVRELDELTDRIAAGFAERGTGPGHLVGVYLDDSIRYALHYIALTKLGAVPVFVNGGLPVEQAAGFLARVGAVALVTDRSIRGAASGLTVHRWDPYSEAPLTPYRHADDDPVLIAHTSGTTGVPKAVPFTHRSLTFGIRQQIGAEWGGRVLHALPQSHASAISILISCVARGSRVLLSTERAAERVAERIESWRPEQVAAFPRVFVDLCGLDLDAYDFGSVSRWLATGDASHERHIRRLVALGNHRNREGNVEPGSLYIDNFGSSELGFAMFRQVHTPGSNRYGRCMGRPFEWVDAQILDESGEFAPDGVVGRLALKAPTITGGYWKSPDLSAENRVRGYWLSGDLAYRDADGRFYHMDRVSDCVSTPGGPLYTCQIEELLLREVPGLSDCTVVGYGTSTTAPPQLLLALCPSPGGAAPDDLRPVVDAVLMRHGLPSPRQLVVVGPEDYVGITGKALKRRLREDAWEQRAAAA
jgi:long-chain acyl-CoA synthetase